MVGREPLLFERQQRVHAGRRDNHAAVVVRVHGGEREDADPVQQTDGEYFGGCGDP
jgi:hypothetical protein